MKIIYPIISIIILNWNGLKDTIECLEFLKKITYPNYEVIVVDNGSKGNDADVLENKYKEFIRLIRNKENLGFAEGNNIAIRQVLKEEKSDYVLLLNNDTLVDPNFLTELVKVAESNPEIGVVGPKIYYYKKPKIIQTAGNYLITCLGQPLLRGLNKIDIGQFDKTKKVDYVAGCALLIKKEAIKKIGLLYKNYFAYFEDAEWCIKARRNGYSIVYVPKAEIWHKGSNTTQYKSPIYTYYHTRNRILFVRRNSNIFLFIFLFLPYFLFFRFLFLMARFLLKRNYESCKALVRGVSWHFNYTGKPN